MPKGLLEQLADGVVLGDGGYLLELERRGHVRAGPFTPEVSITNPQALAELHREFLAAGVDVLQALTFYASEEKLATVGLEGKVDDINRAAMEVARSVAAEGEVLTALTLSMTWAYEPSDKKSSDRIRAMFDRQIEIAVDVGCDFIVAETFTWLEEALIATERAKKSGLPVITTVAIEERPHDMEGYSPAECARRLADSGADVVGINCMRDPHRILPLMAEVRAAVDGYVGTQPVAFRTTEERPSFTAYKEFPFHLDPLQLARAEMAAYATDARSMGINYIGSCCGSVAAHVRAMAKVLGKIDDDEREWEIDYTKPKSAYEYHQHSEML